MLLMIDNYDSFTFNLVQYFQTLGQEILVKRNDEITIEQIEALAPTHLIISPGPCTPNEAGISLAAIEYFAGRLPILGVCLGHQAIAQVFGVDVVRAKRVMHGKTSLIEHNQQGLFSQLALPLQVTRYHSLLINDVPKNFTLDAWFDDPVHGREIMAMSYADLRIYSVQFHPESILTQQGHELLNNFLQL
ncbi:aminodeoxychorismate/anthranilate synthase component II [Shewanella sp. SR43-4]|jgi:para-aminobenzoate synthetase component 2|uniref:Aminodeoxychorismate/anthranilate synthase component II n=1 Tax=Shewanella vesiculosa TaxID=518738 RepID=A0ABV0FT25_9GAMM|nr:MULTISPECIES: aminodeoxychorismate/anthranilate synthase component II [Shewanella]NCQ45407.1 aminodeoxychorismate/anthranilate synthase component II [Shewanella frigidimarina]MBB1316146.1 aminodeoxychorismate/anthranilate synthase component II [Shewanella sp. SR43-4]MBB1320898.1 aminodeoxychorismate/anthranilate synthase component II [Shewanella sp. SR43-8]MBB1475289.1 aminodeoxychorismate/anthranilate synthase component II [Shewanella sp. SG41-3]NCO71466.1 aminodeoxychorismate/anthranilate